jgi:hypothetical protein
VKHTKVAIHDFGRIVASARYFVNAIGVAALRLCVNFVYIAHPVLHSRLQLCSSRRLLLRARLPTEVRHSCLARIHLHSMLQLIIRSIYTGLNCSSYHDVVNMQHFFCSLHALSCTAPSSHSRCGSGNGPNGECCAPSGVVPAAAYDRSPNAERQAYNPVIVETTLVIGPNGKETVASKKIVQGGRRPPSVRQLSSGAGSTAPDAAAAVQRAQRHLQRKPKATARPTPAPLATPAPTTAAPLGPRTRKVSAAHTH